MPSVITKDASPVVPTEADETEAPTVVTTSVDVSSETKETGPSTSVVSTQVKETGIPTPPVPPTPPIPPIPLTPVVSKDAKETETSTVVLTTDTNERGKPTAFVSTRPETIGTTSIPHVVTEGGKIDVGGQLKNRCASDMHDCSTNGTCIPLEGSYACECKLGFEGDGRTCAGKPFSFTGIPV